MGKGFKQRPFRHRQKRAHGQRQSWDGLDPAARAVLLSRLKECTQRDIRELLRDIRYEHEPQMLNPQVMDRATSLQAQGELLTQAGQEQLKRARQKLANEKARAWLDSPGGREALEEMKGSLLSEKVLGDDDVLNRTFRHAVQRRIDTYLESERGHMAMAQLLAAVTEQKIAELPKGERRSWVESYLRQNNVHADHREA